MFDVKCFVSIYIELCFLPKQGAHFQKIHETKGCESEKWSRKTLDGKCDGYMWELGGALWSHLGALWGYFGALWCHLGATWEPPWDTWEPLWGTLAAL